MKKVSARWIPRLLTSEQKFVRKGITQENLIGLQALDSFFRKLLPRGPFYQTRIDAVGSQKKTKYSLRSEFCLLNMW
jgi:hypothetical protein